MLLYALIFHHLYVLSALMDAGKSLSSTKEKKKTQDNCVDILALITQEVAFHIGSKDVA